MKRLAFLLLVPVLLMGTSPNKFDRRDRSNRLVRMSPISSGGAAAYTSPYTFEFGAFGSTNLATECGCPSTLTADTGQAITFARSSSGTCVKADGTGVVCASGQAVVEKRNTLYGLIIERAGTNVLLQSDAIDQSPWTNIGSFPAVTVDALQGPFAGMELMNDASAAEFRGRGQSGLAISGAGFVGFSCWLAAGTASSVIMQIGGAGDSGGNTNCSYSGLSATPTRYSCLSGNFGAFLTSVSIDVIVGTNTAATGTVYIGSCQVERNAAISALGGYRQATSYIPTTASAATRAASSATFTMPAGIVDAEGCLKTTAYYNTWNNTSQPIYVAKQFGVGAGDNLISLNLNSKGQFYDLVNVPVTTAVATVKDAVLQVRAGWRSSGSASEVTAQSGTTATATAAGSYDGTLGASGATSYLGGDSSGGTQCNCWVGHTAAHTSKTSCPLIATP